MRQGDLDDLYMEIILDHYRSPRNKADLSHVSDQSLHENPSCGDTVKLEVLTGENGRIHTLRFDGHGCAISTASASLMSERLIGKTPNEARSFIQTFLKILRGEDDRGIPEEWGDLVVLGGIRQFPMRVKCATLPWHAMEKTLRN